MSVSLLKPRDFDDAVPGLAEVLLDSVAGGASVGFHAALTHERACAWWSANLTPPQYRTWVARDDGGAIVGCVQLQPVLTPNGKHRAEVAKLQVLRSARGNGLASALMGALEDEAWHQGLRLLVLDTHTGSPAEDMYLHWGWTLLGVVQDYADTPDGQPAATSFFFKHL